MEPWAVAKKTLLVWRCHQLLSAFLAKGHLPRVSHQSRQSLMIRMIMKWSWGLCTDLLAFALQPRKTIDLRVFRHRRILYVTYSSLCKIYLIFLATSLLKHCLFSDIGLVGSIYMSCTESRFQTSWIIDVVKSFDETITYIVHLNVSIEGTSSAYM